MEEVFVKIEGFEGYEVSNLGHIMSHRKKSRILSPSMTGCDDDGNHYLKVCLMKDGKKKQRYVHRLVAEAFLPKEIGKTQINHKDGNKKNNVLCNLEWVSQSENVKHSIRVLGNNKHIKKKDRIVYQYNLDGSFVKKYENSTVASKENNIDVSSIIACVASKRKTAGGFMWSREKKDIITPFEDERPIRILQYDNKGLIVRTYKSILEASFDLSINQSHITGVCKHRRGYNSVKGYIFRYEDDDENELIKKYQSSKIKVSSKRNSFITICDGLSSAVDFTGCSFYSIIKCCEKERKYSGKYTFNLIENTNTDGN